MRIEQVIVHEAALPLVRPFRTSFGTEYTKDVLLLEVTTSDGVVGWGECVASPEPLYSHDFNAAAPVERAEIGLSSNPQIASCKRLADVLLA